MMQIDPSMVNWIGGLALLAFLAVVAFYCFVVWHYEKMLAHGNITIKNLQMREDRLIAKLMTVDYEKFAELDLRAKYEAMVAIREVEVTNEFGPDVQEPEKVKVADRG